MKKRLKKIIVSLTLVGLLGGIQKPLHAEGDYFETLVNGVTNYFSNIWGTRSQFLESENPFSKANVSGLFLNSSVGLATLLGTGVYGIALLNRTREFNKIQKWFDETALSNYEENKVFSFSTWANDRWADAPAINGASLDEIKKKLAKDISNDKIKTINKGKKRVPQIKEEISNEKNFLEEKLEYLGQFSNMPQTLLAIAHNNFLSTKNKQEVKEIKENEKSLAPIQALLKYSDGFQSFNTIKLDNEIRESAKGIKTNTNLETFGFGCIIHRPIAYDYSQKSNTPSFNPLASRSWNPFTWSLAPKEGTADKLYKEIFQRYVRLGALQQRINQMKTLKINASNAKGKESLKGKFKIRTKNR